MTYCLQYIHAILFANDTSVSFAYNNISYLFDVINKDLANLNDWFNFKANKLSLNVSKSCYQGYHLMWPKAVTGVFIILKL